MDEIIKARRQRVFELRSKGTKFADIAAELGKPLSTVTADFYRMKELTENPTPPQATLAEMSEASGKVAAILEPYRSDDIRKILKAAGKLFGINIRLR